MKELVLRDLNLPVDQSEMERLVERYIYVRKGETVSISMLGGLRDVLFLKRNLSLLNEAFNISREWFRQNLDRL